MIKPTKVKALDGYSIWIEFDDGQSGEVDLTEFAGMGVFKAWEDRAFFQDVQHHLIRINHLGRRIGSVRC